jgi:hypothetical protein
VPHLTHCLHLLRPQVTGPIGVPALTLFRAFEVVVFAFTVAYGVSASQPGLEP